jgi:hypothetical protein
MTGDIAYGDDEWVAVDLTERRNGRQGKARDAMVSFITLLVRFPAVDTHTHTHTQPR